MKQQVTRILLFVFILTVSSFAQKMTPQELVAKHVASIGDSASLDAAKTRVFEGRASSIMMRGGTGSEQGSAVITVDGTKFNVKMKFPDPTYIGEDVTMDGARYDIGFIAPAVRSRLGQFLFVRPEILREGLFGGVLSNDWTLLDLNGHKPNLKFQGMKKEDGKQLLAMRYEPKRIEGEDQIMLYFDPETFRHVLTTYTSKVLLGADISTSHGAAVPEGEFTLRESFSDFKTENGVTLPTQWVFDLSFDGMGPWRQKWTIMIDRTQIGAAK